MKKRHIMRNRRGVARRGVGFSLFILIGMSTLLGLATQIVTPQIARAMDGENNDLKRRQLHTFAECVSVKFINEGNHTVSVWNDVFDPSNLGGDGQTYMNSRELIVVGLDRESGNGLMTCDTAIRQGVLALNPPDLKGTSENDIRNWFMLKVMGNNLDKTGGKPFNVNRSKLVASALISTLLSQIKIEENKIASPNAQLQQQRYFPLAQICYEGFKDPDLDRSIGDNDAESFKIPGVGYFYRKTSDEVQDAFLKAGFIKKSGITPVFKESVGFGDLNLEFTSERGATNDFNVGSNDFYPIGSDIGKTKDYKFNSVVDCGFIYNNRDIALKGVTLGSSGKITPPEGITSSAAGIGAETPDPGDIKSQKCQIEGALGWVLNPICDIAISSTETLGEHILVALQVEPLTQSANTGTYETWKIFRDFANALLVLVFIIAIFAQVLPLEIDPYTVKKVLPKLIAAAIGIQLSFFICQIMVDITNVLGAGVSGFMNSAIDQLPAAAKSASQSNTASMMFVGIAGAAITVFFIGPVLLLLLAGVISILTMLITIQARQIILIFLAIASPLAILAWVMPNTEQYAKKWGQNYIKLLMMYPLIVFILTGSRLVYGVMSAATTSGGSSSETTIQQIMINFIPVIAFFMIPATFKASGMITGAIASAGFARAGRSKSRAGGMLKSGYVEPLKGGAKNLSKTAGVKMLGSDSKLSRTAGRALTGNMLSFGKSGRRKIANDIKTLKHETLEAQVATVKGMNAGNDVIGEMIAARLAGKDQYTYEDRAGEKQTVKLTDDMVAGGIKYLNDNGGQIELAKIGNGTMHYKQQDSKGNTIMTKDRTGKDVEVTNTATAAFNSANGGSFNKVGKFAMGEIFKETTEGNVAALMKAAPHLVHGKKAALYTEAGGDVFAGIKGDSMDVATEVITSDNSGKAQANFADALVEIMQSSARSGGMDKKTSEKMRDLILSDSRVGSQKIDLGDGKAVALNTVTDKIFTTSGKITYYDSAKRMP